MLCYTLKIFHIKGTCILQFRLVIGVEKNKKIFSNKFATEYFEIN